VLALHSGSAFAMASSLRCVNNQLAARALPPPVNADSPDHYVRVQLWTLPNEGGQQYKYYVKGADIAGLVVDPSKVSNSFLTATQWQQFDLQNNSLTGNKLPSSPTWGASSTLTKNGPWVAVRIDSGGGIVNIVCVVETGSASGSAISGLCWSSFITAAA
jgi:hypothetical protein